MCSTPSLPAAAVCPVLSPPVPAARERRDKSPSREATPSSEAVDWQFAQVELLEKQGTSQSGQGGDGVRMLEPYETLSVAGNLVYLSIPLSVSELLRQ